MLCLKSMHVSNRGYGTICGVFQLHAKTTLHLDKYQPDWGHTFIYVWLPVWLHMLNVVYRVCSSRTKLHPAKSIRVYANQLPAVSTHLASRRNMCYTTQCRFMVFLMGVDNDHILTSDSSYHITQYIAQLHTSRKLLSDWMNNSQMHWRPLTNIAKLN